MTYTISTGRHLVVAPSEINDYQAKLVFTCTATTLLLTSERASLVITAVEEGGCQQHHLISAGIKWLSKTTKAQHQQPSSDMPWQDK